MWWSAATTIFAYTSLILRAVNPFTPGFGEHPAVIAGRSDIISRWRAAFHHEAGSDPATRTWLRGPRGVGKTVLLDAAHDIAVGYGWFVVEENGAMVEPLASRLIAALTEPDAGATTTTLGVNVAGVTAAREHRATGPVTPANIRAAVAAFLDRSPATGVLFSIDEMHDLAAAELKDFANAFQHLVRDGRRVACVVAGLPRLGDEPTFLARAWQPALGTLDDTDIAGAFADIASAGGYRFTQPAVATATHLAAGLPYAMQLIGWYCVDRCTTNAVTLADVDAVTHDVHRDLEVGLRLDTQLSPGRARFAAAMAADPGPSRMSSICDRLGRTPQQLAPVRAWLIDHGVVVAPRRGELDFTHPGMRAWLRTKAP